MNIDKIKEFISMREELKAAGVIGIDMYSNNIHLSKNELATLPGLKAEPFDCDDSNYTHEVSTFIDGIRFFALSENLKEFPQLAGYMEEDVNLEGVEEIA